MEYFITMPGIKGKVRIFESGSSSKKILYIHGWLGTLDNFLPILNRLSSDKYSFITLDLPGFGKTGEFIDKQFTIDKYDQFLIDIIKQQNWDIHGVIGISMGGTLGLRMLSNSTAFPHLHKLLMQSPVYKPITIDMLGKIRLSSLKYLSLPMSLIGFLMKYKLVKDLAIFFGDENVKTVDKELLLDYGLANVGKSSIKALYDSAIDLIGIDIKDSFDLINDNRLDDYAIELIYGQYESLYPEHYYDDMYNINNIKIDCIENGYHFLSLQKIDFFVSRINSFFEL